MADVYIVPPIDDSPEALNIFYQQICEKLNPATDVIENGALPSVTPTDVTGLTATGGFGSVTLNFSDVTYDGHAYTLFVRATDGNFNNAESVGSTSSNRFVDNITDPVIGTTYTYWAINVNLKGERSLNWSSAVTASVSSDVDYSVDILLGKLGYDQFKTGSFPVRTEDVLPTLPDANYPINSYVLLTTNSKTYENLDNANWTIATDVPFDSNTLVAGKIAAGALVVDDGVMQNGYIKTALIDDAQITSAKIVSLNADKINAGTIDVSLILNAAQINSPDINAGTLDGASVTGGTVTGSNIRTSATATTNGGINMTGQTLSVYDSSGVVRVKLGLL